jgi:hypothetical protein
MVYLGVNFTFLPEGAGVNQRTGTGRSLIGSQNGLTNETGKENGIIAQIHDF